MSHALLTRWSGMFQMSVRSVMMHKLRSFLTVLGLVFGVASVIVMMAVAEGASQESQRQIASLGINNVIVRSIKPAADTTPINYRSFELRYGLTYYDLRRVRETLDNAVRVTPLREFQEEARYGAAAMDIRLVGVHPSYFQINRLQIARGRFLDQADLDACRNVCVIGEQVAIDVFRGHSPIGKSIQIANRQFFRVVGVLQYRTPSAGVGSSLSAQDLNRDVVIPLSTDRSRIGDVLEKRQQGSFARERLELSQITIEVRDKSEVKSTAAALQGLISKYHPKQDFSITIPLDLLEQAQATQRIFNFVLGATAAISLLVGGIGIMNIMLASVSERTREIGIRRALGARQSDIVLQFLVETTTLSLLGTSIGLVLGVAAPRLVAYLSGMETIVTPWSLAIAAAVAFAVGTVSGIYPARQAARMNPIEALRSI